MKVRANALYAVCAAALLLLMPVALATVRVNPALPPGGVEVYSKAEIDVQKAALQKDIDEVSGRNARDLKNYVQDADTWFKDGGTVDQRVHAGEVRIKDEVKASIDSLPQRLLSEEAKKALKDAVETEIRDQFDEAMHRYIKQEQDQRNSVIDALRQDIQSLQKQIDDLKRNRGRR